MIRNASARGANWSERCYRHLDIHFLSGVPLEDAARRRHITMVTTDSRAHMLTDLFAVVRHDDKCRQ